MTACVFACADADGLYDCTCSRCFRSVRVRRLPVNAECSVAAPKAGRDPQLAEQPSPTRGPGTALKSLLSRIGIAATPKCSCNARAAEMDARGCDWCDENIETVVGWLREESTKRGLPFLDAAGRLLVRRAIRNARKQAKMKQ